ncbi:deoxyribonuclease V [Marinomonas gallaica]|uniref:deoxyribonuclease V n=1 Tax=Marinomonas gallaica TaxID=1806667 RepID=UPI003CE58735
MKPVINHSWDLTEGEALQLQKDLATRVIKENLLDKVKLVAGVDVAYSKESDKLISAVVIIDAETLEVIETVTAEEKEQFPYIPGLFSFRELPSLVKAFAQLKSRPDLIVCDGQGYAHPRRFGLACHLGVIFDVPTIGCGKSRLIGEYQELDIERGAIAPLIDNGEVIGNVLRTQTKINPIYVSVGHRIALTTATEWILKLSTDYRLPETTRKADQTVNLALKTKL